MAGSNFELTQTLAICDMIVLSLGRNNNLLAGSFLLDITALLHFFFFSTALTLFP